MSKTSNKDEGVGSFVDPAEIEAKKAEEAKKLAKETVDPTAPLFKKLDAMIEALQGIDEKLCRIADNQTGQSQPKTASKKVPTPPPTPAPSGTTPPDEITGVMDLFPEDLRGKMKFSSEGGNVKVAPRQFLGSENFAKIASIVREAGGEYKSAGKDSHFLVPPLGIQTPSDSTQSAPKGGGIKGKFPPVLADMLTFEEAEGKVIVKAKKFLGSDNFAKIATIIRENGGEYISDKKNSRFEVPT